MLVSMITVFILASLRKSEKIAWLTWAGVLVRIHHCLHRRRKRDDAWPSRRGAVNRQIRLWLLGLRKPNICRCHYLGVNYLLLWCWHFDLSTRHLRMWRSRDYSKAVYLCMGIVTASYLSFSLVVYRYCG
ncbi:hypothetical protein HD806DRAFT_217270 [Xylariaceae sp. AK1471]|nr:hypothetical protein HD806DRAFT_217270 [Xylariaceae sp. AK1471]